MKTVDHNILYKDHILLIVYSHILLRSILSQAIISLRTTVVNKINSELEAGKPRTSLHTWKGSIFY
jgi:hypothetical protein